MAENEEFGCIFAGGEDRGCAASGRSGQRSSALHLIVQIPRYKNNTYRMVGVADVERRRDLSAFSPMAKIEDSLRPAAASYARPRCILIVQIPPLPKEKATLLGGFSFGGEGGI